jgi:hypothetical protein
MKPNPKPCDCGCGDIVKYGNFRPGHAPHKSGSDNPNWKGGKELYSKRAYAKVKESPEKLAERKRKIKEWIENKKKTDPEWVKRNNERKRREFKRYRKTVMHHYGGAKCACCGERTFEFLSIDHINGGGNKHRKEAKLSGKGIYRWLVKNGFPEGFRVLCHNCNFSIGAYGYCPHGGRI